MARGRIHLPVELENLLTDDWERVIGQAMLSAEDKEIVRLYIVEQLPQVDVAGELHMDRSTISRRTVFCFLNNSNELFNLGIRQPIKRIQ